MSHVLHVDNARSLYGPGNSMFLNQEEVSSLTKKMAQGSMEKAAAGTQGWLHGAYHFITDKNDFRRFVTPRVYIDGVIRGVHPVTHNTCMAPWQWVMVTV
ncbi:Hypothetical predicted protein [Pelobates cultripes]|uniref:Uncharacterized protein n=1 Tax=Pelobates cultripes TaxID=61616 RepID=A0AAD1VKP4_PELCU|nr:Hypothetical predicted protein [Pelobates cultripes]